MDAIFLDASAKGLGLVVEPCLKVDEVIVIQMGGGVTLKFSVRWIKKPVGFSAPGVPVFHRAGVCLIEDDGAMPNNILSILENFHCVDH